MRRPSYLTRINDKPLKIVRLAPLPPARVKRAAAVMAETPEAAARKNAAAIFVVAFVFWAVYVLMNRFGA
ncbi:MAG TPA: hypothetical protein VK615_09590 [Candidatus Binatia bacterium]|nr:hypothetical protein [Candidatus Binatia bacterium]